MKHYETIIIGGGPAGSSCAWQLKKQNREVLILDKSAFPRLKLCAGWITPNVLKNLEFTAETYPHSFTKLHYKNYKGVPFSPPHIGFTGEQYAIRRIEFDHWLLQRSKAPVETHQVRTIQKADEHYIIDDLYTCKNLVGAGGTFCPVRRTFFAHLKQQSDQLITLEKEFSYSPHKTNQTYLFFLFHGLKGYSWYVPKPHGILNIGLGTYAKHNKTKGVSIHDHFQKFLDDLVRLQLLDEKTAKELIPGGHAYFVAAPVAAEVKKEHCFLIGDAAGLATLDLAEGIGPAVESGLLCAHEILGTDIYSRERISQLSNHQAANWEE